tara:strand:- start:81 stop:257 length:177 start_codon:yes stop_codon:yes gene_type:complete
MGMFSKKFCARSPFNKKGKPPEWMTPETVKKTGKQFDKWNKGYQYRSGHYHSTTGMIT